MVKISSSFFLDMMGPNNMGGSSNPLGNDVLAIYIYICDSLIYLFFRTLKCLIHNFNKNIDMVLW